MYGELRRHSITGTPAKNEQPESNNEEMLEKPKLWHFLQNNWPVLFNCIKVKKHKGLRELFRLKETELTQLNATYNPVAPRADPDWGEA